MTGQQGNATPATGAAAFFTRKKAATPRHDAIPWL